MRSAAGVRSRLLVVLVAVFGVAVIVCLGVITWLAADKQDCCDGTMASSPVPSAFTPTDVSCGDFTLKLDSGRFQVMSEVDGSMVKLTGVISAVASRKDRLKACSVGNEICLADSNGDYQITVTESSTNVETIKCFRVMQQQSLDLKDNTLLDVIEYGDRHWYGVGEIFQQEWPIERWNLSEQAFVAKDSYHPDRLGGVQERYWLSSAGVAIFVPFEVPLYVSMSSSNKSMTLSSQVKDTVYQPPTTMAKLTLEYDVCICSKSMVDLHKYMASNYWKKPADRPNIDVLVKPIWSTWAEYKKAIDQSSLLDYSNKILDNGLAISQLEIDDDWTPHYGDWTFNVVKFPEAKKAITDLKARIPAVTVWVHPFISVDSNAFADLADRGMLMDIRDNDQKIPGLVRWWNPLLAGYLDFSNNETSTWFLQKLAQLKTDFNVDSFKFDAGEKEWMPLFTEMAMSYFHPSEYIQHYVKVAVESDADGRRQEVRVGCRTQQAPILVRMMDKRSKWDVTNGLRTLIPVALTFGLIGYPFVLPDMIGGNEYEGLVVDEELYVRWLQVNVFLPAIQFSIPPWRFGEKVVNHTRDMLQLRESYASLFDRLSNESVAYGWPMVRPLWWICPTDEMCLTSDDQYLLGEDLLVAPVVEKGARARDIYLPVGNWVDKLRSGILVGPKILKDYSVDLYELPYFVRQ